jgi:hypothetical protein
MSFRSMLEVNHDKFPDETWLEKLREYMRSGNPQSLPDGVTFFYQRHHSDPCPLGEPPRGWDNKKKSNAVR